MLEIKTITRCTTQDYDQAVNESLKEGWELVRRDCFVTGSDRATTFYAELERLILPNEVEPELDEYDVEARWRLARDPMHPYHCSECGFKSTTPYPICPGCERLMDSECEGAR